MRLIDADALIEKEERYELDRYIDGERCYEMAVPSCAIIEAPTIEPKQADDLISRTDAIEAIAKYLKEDYALNGQEPNERHARWGASVILENVPSAQPKRGEWKIEESNSVWGKGYLLTCSECGESFRVTETALPYEHFCRNCGARMKGADDEDN